MSDKGAYRTKDGEHMTTLGPYYLGPDTAHPAHGIYYGDARRLARGIPDNSIDLIFTDPPYLREFLWCYGWLAAEASRVLKPGGYLFAYGAGEHMPAILAGMEGKGLTYFWTFVLLHNGGYPRMWNKRLMSGYKPVFVYTKGKPSVNPWMSTVHSVAMDKRYHEWGQGDGLAIKMIDMLTEPGAVIWDPFAGGGATPAACKKTGRKYLAFEIDLNYCNIARERVRNTQPPLLVPQAEQLGLEITA